MTSEIYHLKQICYKINSLLQSFYSTPSTRKVVSKEINVYKHYYKDNTFLAPLKILIAVYNIVVFKNIFQDKVIQLNNFPIILCI